MELKALMLRYGRFALLIIPVVILASCSSVQVGPDNNDIAKEEPAPFEAQSGIIPPSRAQSSVDLPDHKQSLTLVPDHPREYIVQKGDTLWDISSMFLKDPWYWPEIWQLNPQVENPHLIYPGDLLTLVYVNGVPQIQLSRPAENASVIRRESTDISGRKLVKLSPTIHRQSLNEAIPSIPADAIRQFLTRPRVVSEEEWEQAPYIVGSDDAHMILGTNNKVYIRGQLSTERIRYSVFREGSRLEDPETNELLGHEVIYAGQVRIDKFGHPSSGVLLQTKREVLVGDRLLPTDKSAIDQQYFPRLPDQPIHGRVVSLFDAITAIAKYQVAAINRGSIHGLEVGHLLATYQAGSLAKDLFLDRTSQKRGDDKKLEIQLPDERSGIMMIFKVFDKVSYGLIIKSTRTLRRNDKVEKPR